MPAIIMISICVHLHAMQLPHRSSTSSHLGHAHNTACWSSSERSQTAVTQSSKPCSAADLSASLGIRSPIAFRLQQQFATLETQEVTERVLALHAATGANVEDLALIMSKEPRLGQSSLEQASAAYAILCAVMQLSAKEVGSLAVFAPSLLCATAEEITARHSALLQATGLDVARLREVRHNLSVFSTKADVFQG